MTTFPVPALVRESMDDAVQAIWASRRIVLACHINPDGDTLGSMVALGLALETMGKDVTLLSADGVPDLYADLPAIDRVRAATERRDFDLAIGLDAGDLSRVGSNVDTLRAAPVLMDIDHHVTAGRFGQIQLLDAQAAATAELVFDLIQALGVEITPDIAQNLLCGVLTDTGSFRFPSVTPRTLAIGGALVAAGAAPNPIYEAVYENRSYAAQKILGRALEGMDRSDDGRVVWALVTQSDFAACAAEDRDTEGIVAALRAVRGCEVAILLREAPSGRLRVSLRAREPHDVSQVAARFGGGGHRLASGCSLDGPPEAARDAVVAAVRAAIGD